jgi:hypothetical protein
VQASAFQHTAKTNRIQLVLYGMQNRTFGPYLAVINRILISLLASDVTPEDLPNF